MIAAVVLNDSVGIWACRYVNRVRDALGLRGTPFRSALIWSKLLKEAAERWVGKTILLDSGEM